MRFFINSTILYVCVLALVGCTNYPNPMPRGYSSYNQPYKSAPGPLPPGIGYSFDGEQNDSVIEDMRYAARDLVERLDRKLSFSVDRIHLSVSGQNAFYGSFDHLLREEFTRQGYLLSENADKAINIDFVAAEDKNCPLNIGAEGSAYRHLYLALLLTTQPETPPEVIGGFYEVPTYGFNQKSLGFSGLDVPSCIPEETVSEVQ